VKKLALPLALAFAMIAGAVAVSSLSARTSPPAIPAIAQHGAPGQPSVCLYLVNQKDDDLAS
jgi:hypothetical protein